jgi:hypothetical protein
MRICDALSKGENPLSSEEIHFMQMCYQILKINSDDKVAFNATAADEGRGDPALTIAEIQKLLGVQEEPWLNSTSLYQTTRLRGIHLQSRESERGCCWL